MAPYPSLRNSPIDQLFLTYTGYSIGTDGTPHYQFWECTDFLPLLFHTDPATGLTDGVMFTDFLFLALGILNQSGEGRFLARHDKAPANWNEWLRYMDELFLCDRNLDALCQAVRCSPLSRTNVWIALPYPNPQVFGDDECRIQAVVDWMCLFLERWATKPWQDCLSLKGFYWLQESLYFQGPEYDDRRVIQAVNAAIHSCKMVGQPLRSIWIPYQQAAGWNEWSQLGFDLAFLQPNAYFNPKKSLDAAAVASYDQQMGVEIEFDLGVTYDQDKRARLLEYLRAGAAGGTDRQGQSYGPFQYDSPLAWYTGGWFFGKNGRKQAMVSLYQSGDPLYEQLFYFLNGMTPP
ncbi:DUF4855 domain-containing protein [Brevibacillus parabrevis]|uniref:DUF4855 domain-containing protein n=1 Tax=Brevibacillus parabrevis TaxID=54914 RepID=UPI0028D8A7CE|nr:DUF4855 domain-containing protein [Brevibacillus parabrevis]